MPPGVERFLICRSGANAVEFALLAPVMMLLLFGIIAFGYIFGVYHGVQQIASEAARASVSGLTDPERATIARDFVASNVPAYALLDPDRLTVVAGPGAPPRQSFEVAIRYDLSGTLIADLAALIALKAPQVERRAVVLRGGY